MPTGRVRALPLAGRPHPGPSPTRRESVAVKKSPLGVKMWGRETGDADMVSMALGRLSVLLMVLLLWS